MTTAMMGKGRIHRTAGRIPLAAAAVAVLPFLFVHPLTYILLLKSICREVGVGSGIPRVELVY